jgi:hypothetical protein
MGLIRVLVGSVIVVLLALVSKANAGWLSAWDTKPRRLAAPVVCVAQPTKTELHLDRGTQIREVEHEMIPPHRVFDVVDVLSGQYRGWRCEIETSGHPPLTIDEKKPSP